MSTRTRVKNAAQWTAVVVVALAAGFLFLRAKTNQPMPAEAEGSLAADFTLPLLEGPRDKLSEHRGNPIVLNFWASWCHSCKQQAPVLASGSKSWAPKGVHFLGVASDDAKSAATQFTREYRLGFPVFFDGAGSVERRYGLTGHPETFFLDATGKVRAKWIGPLDEATLNELVGRIVDGRRQG